MTTPQENQATPPNGRRVRASSRPPGTSEDQSRRRPRSRRPESTNAAATRAAATRHPSSSAAKRRPRPAVPLPSGVDAVCDGLTVTYDIRYVHGEEGERVAAAQAAAISALLNWLAHRDPTTPRHGGTERATEEGAAA